MKFRKMLASFALGSMLATTAMAQTQSPSDADSIVVTGTKMTRGQAHDLAQNYTRAVLAPSVSDQNARWATPPICLSVIGLRDEAAYQLMARIEETARAVGAPVAEAGCSPNVFLAFSANSDADFENMIQKRAELLADTSPEEVRKLRSPGLPIRWFYTQTVEGLGGRTTTRGDQGVALLKNVNPGRIDSPIQVSIIGCTVVVDMPRVSHVSIGALTDYLAFAILSRTRMDATPNASSIMNLFEASQDERPDAMTDLDKAMLKALYRIPINRNAAVHRAQIASEIIKEISAVQ